MRHHRWDSAGQFRFVHQRPAATKAARGKRPPPNSRRRSRCSRPRPGGSPNSCHAWTTASRGWPTPRTGSAGRWRRSSTASATPTACPTRSPPRDHHRPAEAPEHQRGGDTRRRHRPRAEASHDGPPRPGAPCPPPRDRPHGKARAAHVKEAATAKRPRRGMHSPSMPASKPPCVATARSWPTVPADDGRTQCDSMVCSTRPGRVPVLSEYRAAANLESPHVRL